MPIIKRSTILFALLLFLRIQCHAAPVPRNQVHFINVGQAEAILLELEHDAILIDAGGECTCDDRDSKRLTRYLDDFFARRTDLTDGNRGRIHTIIISHPHIDHTMLLMDVMRRYRVQNFVDGGNESGSGIVQLWAARYYAQKNGINYDTVKDSAVTVNGLINAALQSVNNDNPGVTLKFLAGSRGCHNANNDSLILWAQINGVKFLFTGDDEALVEPNDCEPEIPFLLNRFKNTSLLDIDVYKVGHHGSFNGTSLDFVKALTPKISVMSAGQFDQKGPGEFHAWQFGHPREDAVKTIEANTTNTRAPITITTMDSPAHPRTRVIKNAVYCTCWDNNVVVEVLKNGSISVH
jgi:competence protein ComEC